MPNELNNNALWGGGSLLLRRRAMMMKKAGILPAGFEELMYIKASGTQWLDMNFLPTGDTIAEMKIEKVLTNASIWGAWRNDYEGFASYGGNNNSLIWDNYDTADDSFRWGALPEDVVVLRKEKGDTYIDGNRIFSRSYHQGFLSDNTFCIFNIKNFVRTMYPGRLYYFKASDAAINVDINCIPALRTSDSKPGMYDIVNKVFYTNQGTGEFGYETLDGTIVNPV